MAQKGGQQWQAGLHLEALPIPAEQDVHRQRMAEIVQPRTAPIRTGLQASPAHQSGEHVLDVLADEPLAGGGYQQARCLWVGEVLVAKGRVVSQGLEAALMQGDLPALAELCRDPRYVAPSSEAPVSGGERDRE